MVFTGGGSFGAFEAGAVQAFFESWTAEHCPGVNPPCEPPVRVIAGCSTGALIGPFVALGGEGVKEVVGVYRSIGRADIVSIKAAGLLPFALFSKWSPSEFSTGPLRKMLDKRLPDPRLAKIADGWPDRRLVVLATDLGTGRPATFTSDQIRADPAAFRLGVLTSTAAPLAFPPVLIKPGQSSAATPNVDGGIHAVAPFQALFDLAAREPAIQLTHLIVFSSFPRFPTPDSNPIQTKFPPHPKFDEIGARMITLLSEASVAKETALVWAAIELRSRGVSAQAVKEQTGLDIPDSLHTLIVYEPPVRLGWDCLKFDKAQMNKMADLGRQASPRILTIPR